MTNQTDPLDEILEKALVNYAFDALHPDFELNSSDDTSRKRHKDKAKAAINAEIAKARIEGAEMCHNALFYDSKSVNNIIELDTGETAIRYNNLIKELEQSDE